MAGKSTISITFKLDGDEKGFKDLAKDAEGLKKVMNSTIVVADKLKQSVINFAAIATGIDQAQKSIQQLQGVFKELTDTYAIQAQAETQLETVMRQRMGATDKEIKSIKDLASAQQKLGVIGDEVQLAGAQQVATFLTSKRSIETLLPAMNNLLAQQKGLAATSQDAVNIANLMGKAMQGQTAALRRVGITFDDAQDKVLKYGTESQRAAMLAQVITENVGNMNAELAKTDIGKQKQLDNKLGDIKEQLGAIAQGAMPFITIAANTTIALAGIVKLISGVKAATVAVSALNIKSKLAGVSIGLLGLKSSQTAAVTRIFSAAMTTGAYSATAFKIAVRGLLIPAGIGVAFVAATNILEKLTAAMDEGANAAGDFANAEDRAKRAAEEAAQMHAQEKTVLQQTRAALEINIQKLKDFKGGKEKEKKIVEEMNNTYGSTMGYFKSVAEWYNALIKNSEAYCQQMIVEARTRTLANQIAQKEQENHGLIYDDKGKRKMYSKQRETKRVAHVDANSDSANPSVSYTTEEVAGTSDWEKATAAVNANNRAIVNLRKQMQNAVNEAKKVKFAVQGSATAPELTTKTTEKNKTRLQQLNALIDAAKDKYVKAGEAERAEIAKNIEKWKAEKAQIELLQRQAERPAVLNSLQAIDEELAYQQQLRRTANSEALAGIDAEINRLTELRRAMDQGAHVETPISQIGTYEQLNKELQYYNQLLQTSDATQRVSVQNQINQLNILKSSWDEVLSDLKKPGDISMLDTIEKLDEAIAYYHAKQKKQSTDEITNTQRVIAALEQKRAAMQRGISLTEIQNEIGKTNGLSGRDLKVRVRGVGFDELTNRIQEMRDLLRDTDNPVTDGQRAEIESIIATYEKWRRVSINTFDTVKSGWGGIRGIGDSVQSVTDALEGNGRAWQTVTGIVDGFIQLYEGIQTIVGIIDMLTVATTAHTAAKTAEGTATGVTAGATLTAAATQEAAAAAAIPVIATNKLATASYMELASAMYFAAHASIPFAGFGIAAGFITAATAMVQAIGVTPFAKGGIVSGPTLALVGEYSGAENNPEVIAPLDKLRSMIQPAGSVADKVQFRIVGRDLVGVIANETRISSKSGRRTNIKL